MLIEQNDNNLWRIAQKIYGGNHLSWIRWEGASNETKDAFKHKAIGIIELIEIIQEEETKT